jgi:hypothetical protein
MTAGHNYNKECKTYAIQPVYKNSWNTQLYTRSHMDPIIS